MGSICLIDTSIFLNLLNVHNCNESRKEVLEEYKIYIELGCVFLLPFATILETGNHIAQNGDGNQRRQAAQRFTQKVQETLSGQKPWKPIDFPTAKEISTWLEQFPNLAGQNKAPNKFEGTSFGDLSIIQNFKRECRKCPMSEVFIWSLDQDLQQSYRPDTGSR
jgi:hypothetical protein